MRKNHWATVTRRTLLLGILGLLVSGIGPASAEQKIYWSSTAGVAHPPRIQKSNFDGSNVETVFEQSVTTGHITNMELDTTAGKIYWMDGKFEAIMWANRDGSNTEILISGLSAARGLALDLSNGKIYFTRYTGGPETGSIERSNLDGTGREVVLAGIPYLNEIAVDGAGGKVYWGDQYTLHRANLDGTGVELIYSSARFLSPSSIGLDLINGHIYFYGDGIIQRTNLDGTSGGYAVLSGTGNANRLEVDAAAGKIYWTALTGPNTLALSVWGIKRANLDGTVIETLLDWGSFTSEACGLTGRPPVGLALDLAGGKLLTGVNMGFSALQLGSIQQSNLDGTGVEILLPFPEVVLCNPGGIAIDQGAGKIYWTERTRGVGRANLDGSSFETVHTDSKAADIAFDPRDGKIYWSAGGVLGQSGRVRRANGDGSNVETFFPGSGVTRPRGITLDPVNDKIYWTDAVQSYNPLGPGAVHRMNLDGTGWELIDPLKGRSPVAVAVDPAAGKIYYGTDYAHAGTINRADLDGLNLEQLAAPALNEMTDFAIDASACKLYWSSSLGVGRLNLPGLGLETLHDIQVSSGIALNEELPAGRSLVSLPDINSNGVPDLAVMRDGSNVLEIRDGLAGAPVREITFLSDAFTPIAAVALPDSDSNAMPELAVLAVRNSDGRIVVEMRNAAGSQLMRQIWFAANHTPIDIKVITGDADNNGIAEIAVLSTRNSDGRGLVEVKNAFGPTNPQAVWVGAGFTPSDFEIVDDADANGVPEVAILSTRNSDCRILAEIKNANGPTNPNTVWFAPGHTPIDLTVVPDKDANGIPEVAVLSSRNIDGRNLVETKNAAGATLPSNIWFAAGHRADQLEAVNDADTNGIPEVAVFSTRRSDGRIRAEVKNVTGAVNQNSIWYSPGFTGQLLTVFSDTDSNGIEEALVLMIRDSDGRILVQGRNVAGNPAPIQYWFSP